MLAFRQAHALGGDVAEHADELFVDFDGRVSRCAGVELHPHADGGTRARAPEREHKSHGGHPSHGAEPS
jgi:hypothetical protein